MCKSHRNPVHCILPPYIVDKLLKSEDPEIFELGINNSFRTTRFRSDRVFFSKLNEREREYFIEEPVISGQLQPNIKIHDCKQDTKLPGDLMDNNSNDADFKNVMEGVTETWKFYFELFKRNSIDNAGMTLINSIHYSKMYGNAEWDGRRMIYGDGDGVFVDSMTKDIDIIAHELTHGVTLYTSNFNKDGQSGALEESFSDVMGIMVKQRVLNQDVTQSSWLIGENVFIGDEYAVRSLKEPGSAFKNHPRFGDDPQPATYDKYDRKKGVHINSGIPNFAFYMAAFDIGGNSWEKAGRIWYETFIKLPKAANFIMAKEATIKKANELYGKGSLEVKAVENGWKNAKVGV